jgi:iron complex transport system substrate-binding protein
VRIVSLLPSTTEIVCALGLADELVGRCGACDHPADVVDIPTVTLGHDTMPFPAGEAATSNAGPRSSASRGNTLPALLGHALHGGREVEHLDAAALVAARPDLVLTHPGCPVCSTGRRQVEAVLADGGVDATVVDLAPVSIEGIFHGITTIGAMTEAEDEAIGLLELLRERLGAIEERVQQRRQRGIVPPRVVTLGWVDPPFACGAWIPEQVRRAGGWDLMGREGVAFAPTTWSAIADVDPDHLLLAPAGLHLAESAATWNDVKSRDDVAGLRAVRRHEVVALDAASYFTRPGPRIVEGIALLAELFDPHGFVDEAPSDGWTPVIVG